MRLIDGDAITLALRLAVSQLTEERREFLMDFRDGLEAASNACEEAPTIDAVPVVRCKDCKYHRLMENKKEFIQWHNCTLLCADIDEDDFCSYGERKE